MLRSPSDSLAGLRLALAGPGRVGTSLAAWAAARGAEVVRVGGRRVEAARGVTERLGGEAVSMDRLESAGCDLLLVAVADGALAAVAAELATRSQAPVVLHTSGSLGASALAPLAGSRSGASATGSFHPLKAFPRPLPEPADLERASGTFYALDGEPSAIALGERLAAAFGGVSGVVPEAARDLYHLGATVAAGGVATLLLAAGDVAAELGLPDEAFDAVRRGYAALARGAIDALVETGGSPDAITGPLARGDHETFLRELERLRAAGPSGETLLPLLRTLGLRTVRRTAGADAEARLDRAIRERLEPLP